MRFKKDKEQVLYDAMIEAEHAANAVTSQISYSSVDSIQNLISQAIARGIMAGLRSLLNNQYTEEDFEKDIGLDQ